MQTYSDFLESKRKMHAISGFDCNDEREYLFPFQNFVVNCALKHGKYAIFSGTGTGKTRMELAWCDAVSKHTNKPVLILAPLAVTGQTIQEGAKIGITVNRCGSGSIQITNYEQLDNIDLSLFAGICLDESSILKNFEGKYRNALIELCQNIDYKLCGTATPSPNDEMELGNHSEFLNVMSRSEMLAMYFVHDAGNTQSWRLKGHARTAFYEWLSSWAIMFQHPRDIGFNQDGYDLPALNLYERKIITEKRDNGKIFNDTAVNATNFNAELRITINQRLEDMVGIINSSNEQWLIWIKQDVEGEILRKLIPNAIEVKGSDKPEYKEKMLLGFGNGEFRVLITKTKIAAMGLNYQRCGNQWYPSPDFSFEGLFQGIRRSWRFGRRDPVSIYITTTDTMQNVIESLKQKEKQFENMQQQMTEACNKTLNAAHVSDVIHHEDYKTDNCWLMHGDSVQRVKEIENDSINFSIQSPPFASLYTYSDRLEDMGNSKDYNEFFTAYNFLIQDYYRILKPGHLIVQHCMDLPIQKGKEGYIGLRSFSNDIIQAHLKAGFIFHSEVVLWKNPVTEMQRTKALGLLHKQLKKDSCMSRVGIPDKLLVFRKPGENTSPVNCNISVDLWQKYASPVWMDVDFGNTLNARSSREEKDERHIAPLSLDIIDRCLTLWTNEGDVVFSSFGGIGSEPYQSILRKRKAIAIELKASYFTEAVKNVKQAENISKQQTIFG